MKRQPSLLRRLFRRSWQIVLLWLVVSAPLVYLIFLFIQPTYEAFSLLRVEPAAPNLFAQLTNDDSGNASLPYLKTQVQLIKSDLVLAVAVGNPQIAALPSIKESLDPKMDLRKTLVIEIVQDAYLIRVTLESKNPAEAASIVNAVVESYRAHTELYAQSANKRLRESLDTEDRILQKKIDDVQSQWSELVQNGKVAPTEKEVLKNNAANLDNFKVQNLSHQLTRLQTRQDQVQDHLQQLAFASNQEPFRIILVDPAVPPRTPSNDSRIKYMAAVPGIVFFVIFGLFLLLEIISGRSARTAELSSARLRGKASDLLDDEFVGFKR